MLILAYVLILCSILAVTWFFMSRIRFKFLPVTPSEEKEKKVQKSLILRVVSLIARPLLPFTRIFLLKGSKQNLADRISSAEVNFTPESFIGAKIVLILVLFLGIFMVAGRLEPIWFIFIILSGYILPDIYLKIRIQKRNRLILKALPDVIDLLTLCVGGGLDFMQGIDWVIKRSPAGPLIKELSMIRQEVKVGKSRQVALKAMSRRLKIPEVFSLVNTLVSADRMGSPVYETLNTLGEETRRQRFQRGERLALQAPIKMLFPLVFFILPVVAIIVGGPILIQFMQGGLTEGLGKF
ncbi:type II secretion system F family protein [Candidatus Omnitrophota bacterium]